MPTIIDQFLKSLINMFASVALVLATGSAVNSSPVHDTALLLNDNISQSDDEHTDQESHSHKCHGLVSCEIQNETPPFKQMKSCVITTELFVRPLSNDRSIFALHPEPPPPES